MLALSSAAAVTSVAGCLGDDGGDGNGGDSGNGDSDGNGGNEAVDVSLDHPSGELFPESNYNAFAGEAYNYTLAHVLFDPTGKSFNDGSIEWVLLDDFSIDDNDVETWEFTDEWTWWNGDDLTAEDYYTSMEIARIVDGDASEFEEIELVDDYTIRAHRKEPMNTSLRAQQVSETQFDAHRDNFNPWLEQLVDASNQNETDDVIADLTGFEITHTDIMENGWGNSPYQITNVEQQRLELEPYEDHPWADDVKIQQLSFVFSEDAGRRQKIVGDEYDLQTQELFPENLRGEAEDHLQNVARYGAMWNWGLKLNWGSHEALQQRGVRRAMATAISIPNIITNNDGHGIPIEVQTGMDPDFNTNWLGEDLVDQLFAYPAEQDYERADEFLEDADYSREDGTVYDPDGNEVTMEFMAQNSSPRFNVAQTVSGQLDNYGFNIDFRAIDRNQFVDTYYDSMDDWDLCVESHYGGSWSHPLAYYNIEHMFGMILAHHSAGRGQVQQWIDEGTEVSPYNGKPLTPTIPSEPGALEVSGDGEELNLYEANRVLSESTDEEETREMTRKLARFWNYALPDIDLIQRENGSWGDTRDFQWPDEEAPEMTAYRGPFYAIKKGMVDHVYE